MKDGKHCKKIKGHLFYSAPEILKPTKMIKIMKGYDKRSDVYSLGIIFFQVRKLFLKLQLYRCISQQSFEKIVINFDKEIAEKEKDENAKINYLQLVLDAHKNNYVIDQMLKRTGDDAFQRVLGKMVCRVEKRMGSEELLK